MRCRSFHLGPRSLTAVVALLTVAACSPPAQASGGLASRLRDGDLIFQRSKSAQGQAIKAASGSDYTHMGMIFIEPDGTPRVFEAVQPVKVTPLSKWIRRGKGGHFVVKRLKAAHAPVAAASIAALRTAATAMLGKDYDARFEWSDKKLYCSEYVWKTYKRALNLELGRPQPWSELNMTGPAVRRLAKKRLGHLPDPDALVITPVRMLESDLLEEVARGGA